MIQERMVAILRLAAAVLLVTLLSVAAIVSPNPVPGTTIVLAEDDDGGDDDEKKDKDEEKDEDKDEDDGDEGDDDGEDDDEIDAGEDDGDRAGGQVEAPVTAAEPLSVDVSCAWDSSNDRSTCAFVPVGADTVSLDLLIPVQGVCADVTGGDYETDPLDPDDDGATAYYSARSGETEVVLVLTGDVSTAGSTIYWVETDAGRQPAAGLGLTCALSAPATPAPSPTPSVPDDTGSITVQAYRCAIAAPTDAETFDWYGECPDPGDDLAFDLFLGNAGTPAETELSDDDGRITFASLRPGTYRLEESGGDWCHAESDGVDASGNVVVAAGIESTVWIFQCAEDDTVT